MTLLLTPKFSLDPFDYGYLRMAPTNVKERRFDSRSSPSSDYQLARVRSGAAMWSALPDIKLKVSRAACLS